MSIPSVNESTDQCLHWEIILSVLQSAIFMAVTVTILRGKGEICVHLFYCSNTQ